MDEEKLHKELGNHIRKVFDNYEDTDAYEGWLLLREKFPAESKQRSLSWLWYAAAATVLLCMGIWLFPNKDQYTHHLAAGKAVPHNNQLPIALVDTATRLASHTTQNNNTISTSVEHPDKHPSVKLFAQNNVSQGAAGSANSASAPANHNLTADNSTAPVDANRSLANTLANHIISTEKPDSIIHFLNPYTQNQARLPEPINKKSAADLFNEKAIINTEKPEQINRKVTFSVYAATYVNYAKGSNNPINVGAGFTSDIRITHKLKLSTGLAIAQNRLNYSNDYLPNSAQNESTFASLAAAAAESSGKPLTGDGTMKSLVRYATTLDGSRNYSVSLTGLDIPVNLKYEFNPHKNDTYIAAGISSGTFVNETYRSVYTYSEVSKESDSHNSFSGFDLAQTLNVSFGVGYPLGKNRLIVEPFFKYPLDGLGAQQIRFGASGVNLRLHFR